LGWCIDVREGDDESCLVARRVNSGEGNGDEGGPWGKGKERAFAAGSSISTSSDVSSSLLSLSGKIS
jgi:hypothetical protein